MNNLTLLERRLRITTGLIMATYIIIHLSNHTLGLISLQAMEAMREVVTRFWRSGFGGLLLYGSIITHFSLGLMSLYRRTTLRIPAWELTQLLLGLSIIPLLAGHIAATWGGRVLMDSDISYELILKGILADGWLSTRQTLLVIIAWSHACMGLHFFFRLFDWYRKSTAVLYPLAILMPLLVILALVRVGADIGVWQQPADTGYGNDYSSAYDSSYGGDDNSSYQSEYGGNGNSGYGYDSGTGYDADYGGSAGYGATTADNESAAADNPTSPRDLLHNAILAVFYGLLALTLAARWLRHRLHRRRALLTIRHSAGHQLKGRPEQSLLEIIRSHEVPHASVCGGRGRCTTCRVRIDRGLNQLPPPGPLEHQALQRIGAAANVRLACQTRPLQDLSFTPLLPSEFGPGQSADSGGVNGEEREVLAMFVDLRDSTGLAEQRLPYDVLFILNRFFLEMSAALDNSHGHYAQFAGDGLMALYGLDRGLKQGCIDALRGAVDMQRRIDRLNDNLQNELQQPLRIGIGIHCGEAIVGTMGPPSSPNYSAIGDNINAAARLEGQAGALGCTLVVSAAVVELAGTDFSRFPSRVVSLKGKQRPVQVYTIEDVSQIAALLN